MSNIDKRAQKELYAKVERQAHSRRGNPREYQVVTGLCPVNVIEMHAQKIQALLDELEAAEKRIAELEVVNELFLRAKALMYHSGGTPIDNSLNPIDAWLYDAERAAAAGKGEAS